MYHYIYKTINKKDGKYYYGKHSTKNLNDGYLGSGILLNNAIKKHGKENFERIILKFFDNDYDLNQAEKKLITEDCIKDKMCYNIALGGYGGNIVLKEGHPLREKTIESIKRAHNTKEHKLKKKNLLLKLHEEKRVGMYGKKQTQHQKDIVSKVQSGRQRSEEELKKHKESYMKTINQPNYIHPNTGKIFSEEHKRKISENHSDMSGSNNPMFGKQHKEDSILKLKQAARNRAKTQCEYCSKLVDVSNYGRWHGQNCKNK